MVCREYEQINFGIAVDGGKVIEKEFETAWLAIHFDIALANRSLWRVIMKIKEVLEPKGKQEITRAVLEALPDWFGVEESREEYIKISADLIFYAAFDKEKPVGFICLKETGKDTAEICVMGVLKEYHHMGIGKALFEELKNAAIRGGYSFLQVKTVQMGRYDDYDATNRFYLSLGFKEFEVFPTLWDEWNPCQVYVIALK